MNSVDDAEFPFSAPEHVIIAGAGIIGICSAYYLAKIFGIRVTLIDLTGTIAPAASGKAGGFLALEWNDQITIQQLTRRSFELHQELAEQLSPDSIHYRRLTCSAVQAGSANRKPGGMKLQGIEWAQQGSDIQSLGTKETIAQVHPKLLCQRLWEETCNLLKNKKATKDLDLESKLVRGKVISAVYEDLDQKTKFKGVELEDGSFIAGDALLLACGPWTASTIVHGIKYHSVVVPTRRVLEQCVFFSGLGDPEVYVRPDCTAYCTGFPDPACVVTDRPGEEQVDSSKIDTIIDAVRKAACSEDGDEGDLLFDSKEDSPLIKQACYLPTTSDGIPIMGSLRKSCYIATGHTCWGILLGPATGESMATLIATGKGTKYVDLEPFRPSRYATIETEVSI